MKLGEAFRTALDSLNANKLRSVLTMLGIIIGVGAVIALLSVGNGFSKFIEGEISDIGTNLIFIVTDFEQSDGVSTLTLDNVAVLNDSSRAPAVLQAGAEVTQGGEVLYGGKNSSASVSGVTGNYFSLNNRQKDLEFGNLFSEQDAESGDRVVIVGANIIEDLFTLGDFPIGKNIRINGVSYEIIGTFKDIDNGPEDNSNNTVYMPMNTALKRLAIQRTRNGDQAVNFITAQAINEDSIDEAKLQIAEILREEHGILFAGDDDFQIIGQDDLLETFGAITAGLTVFLGAIAGISLLVGGIGIMNIMLVSVTERTREIGIRKAIGALKRDILTQFMIESLILSLIGGLIGIALGWSLTILVKNLPGVDFTPAVTLNSVILSVSFSLLIGLIFGIYPAWRAASLRPIEALRYE